MKVFELQRTGGLIVDAINAARALEAPRTGVHCSTIVNDILRRLDPKKYDREMAESTRLGFQEVGNVVEDVIARELTRRLRKLAGWAKPIPKVYRGIWGSPDGWTEASRTIDEIKATWVSERDFLQSDKFDGYMFQSLFYADAWDARRIRLHVLFINGAYPKGAPFPSPRSFTIIPSSAEKRANTNRLVQHGIDMGLLAA